MTFCIHDAKSNKKLTTKNCKKIAAAPPDPRIKEFILWFGEIYQTVLGVEYIVSWPKESKLVKSLLTKLDVGGLKRASENMFNDDWGKSHASISLLNSQINQWRSGGRQKARQPGFTPAKTKVTYNRPKNKIAVKV